MSLFLNDVRVFELIARSGGASPLQVRSTPSEDEESSSPGATISPSPSPTPSRHHSDSGNEFLAVPICAIVFTFIYLIIKAIMAPFTQRAKYARAMPTGGGGLTPEEVAVLHKIQRTLAQMESRVEALETILIEQARTEKNYGPKL